MSDARFSSGQWPNIRRTVSRSTKRQSAPSSHNTRKPSTSRNQAALDCRSWTARTKAQGAIFTVMSGASRRCDPSVLDQLTYRGRDSKVVSGTIFRRLNEIMQQRKGLGPHRAFRPVRQQDAAAEVQNETVEAVDRGDGYGDQATAYRDAGYR